jgi:hypothetical protein
MSESAVQPNTMCAIGKYTISAHNGRKSTQAENFIRSATAPLIRAAVMTAKVIWNITKT